MYNTPPVELIPRISSTGLDGSNWKFEKGSLGMGRSSSSSLGYGCG